MKKSELVTTCVISGGVLLAALHHGTVYRDQYRTRAECEADWGRYSGYCQEESAGGSGYRYYGPSYESGARPRTLEPRKVAARETIKRSGFGFSGARFSAGG
ncbi:hypothetical protein [Aquipseudomonas alcaligenes]|uniref:Uncharacterized protein n=1 Tax=Aquipseudomonas alcaligenes TaxID=43263 RepID=A0A1N6WPC0_AQUAC|nr:hypothetical protein [Pseudomonas alcaligenes]SIQ91876.1 hypothetical protein SAMN05878282_110104 [Pseudomonas alcaligenes]